MAQPAESSKIFWMEMGARPPVGLYPQWQPTKDSLAQARVYSSPATPPCYAQGRRCSRVSHVVTPSLPACLMLMKSTGCEFIPHDELRITRWCEILRIETNFSLAPTLSVVIFLHYLVLPPSVKETVFHFTEQ